MQLDGLKELDKKIYQSLDFIESPPSPWNKKEPAVLTVGIIGAGMAGIAAAFALLQQGIVDFQIFDAAEEGLEGPWVTYARMNILRSGKQLTGPANAFPLLTFHAWYEAQYGELAWEELYKIPRSQWMDYLNWFRKVLNLPVNNGVYIQKIDTSASPLKLVSSECEIPVRKIVLATGRGVAQFPDFMKGIPRDFYAHTMDSINFKRLKDKTIGIIGGGASAFDAASTMLEEGALEATILIRRKDIPRVNKAASLVYPGFLEGYYFLPDNEKIEFMKAMRLEGTPPPHEAIERVRKHSNFHLEKGVEINKVEVVDQKISLATNAGIKFFDFLILATGFVNDIDSQPMLFPLKDRILTWGEKAPSKNVKFDSAPYLGGHFQLISKDAGQNSFLKNIYCFNHSAAMSHGMISSDIPGIGIGAQRLAQGIAIDLFTEDSAYFLENLRCYNTLELSYEQI